MTQRFTPSGVPIPPNPFVDAESPTNWTDEDFLRELQTPNLDDRLERAVRTGEITRNQALGLIRDLRQHRRAMLSERELPGELTGDPRLPHLPMPFAQRAEHPADRERGTPRYDQMRRAVENLDASTIQQGLVAQMSRNDEPSTHARTAERASAPPSLRDSITAAVDSLQGD